MLHEYYPCFLELNYTWVDELLEKEWDIKDNIGLSSLI